MTRFSSSLNRCLRSITRSIQLVVILIYGALELIVTRPATRQQRAQWLHTLCARAMRTLGVTLRLEGTFPERGVVIANHLGYLDIIAFAALRPCVFVSKSEIRNWPLIGWMTTMSGTVYVDRGRGGSAVRAGTGMHAAAEAGLPVVFFPEGTTTDGTAILKFHSGLLAQSMEAQQPITAAYIRYRLTQDNGPTITVPTHVAYWGKVNFVTHVFTLLGLRGIEIDIRIAQSPIAFTEDTTHRKLAAAHARRAVIELSH